MTNDGPGHERHSPSTSDWRPKEIFTCMIDLRSRVETSILWPILVPLTRSPLSLRQIALNFAFGSQLTRWYG